MSNKTIHLFTDCSVNPQSNFGFGSYFIIEQSFLHTPELRPLPISIRFNDTNASKLELQILLFALNTLKDNKHQIISYTDSQTIINLPSRRSRLESQSFISKKEGQKEAYQLYKEFFHITDQFSIQFQKVIGHKKTSTKNRVDQLFALVDKASRKALRDAH